MIIGGLTPEGREKLRKLKGLDQGILGQLNLWGAKTEQRIKQYTLAGAILKSTGQLKRNVGYHAKLGTHGPQVAVGTGIKERGLKTVKYARIHEKGGNITPKKAKALTIPFRGVKGRARNYPGTFIIKAKGKAFLVRRAGKGLEWLYTLKQKVHIPARHWLSRSIKDMTPYLNTCLKPDNILKRMKLMRG